MQSETEELLATSLLAILKKKSIDHITIKDIVTECDVTRQTFYNHFADIYELVEWIAKRSAAKFLQENSDYNTWQKGFYNVMVAIKKNDVVVHNIYDSAYRDLLEEYLYKVIYQYVIKVVKVQAQGMEVDQEHEDFIAHFYSLAFIALISEWARKGMREDPQEIIEQTAVLVQGDFKKALRKYAK